MKNNEYSKEEIVSPRQGTLLKDDIEMESTDTALSPYGDDEEDASDLLMQDPFDPAQINIIPKPDTLRNLIERLKYDEIDMNTDFQRHADLWDPQKMSRLIESILIRFPLPAFYFDASNEDKWLIVDGLQRLSAIRKFVVEQKLTLRGLEYLKIFNGKTYDQLPRTYQRRIDECTVTLFLIQPGTPDVVKYSIFRRINTGGLVLNDQEIRNAITTPKVRTFLAELAEDVSFKNTVGDQTKRMLDQELVLRYLAFQFMDYEQSKKNITTFLDEMIKKLEAAKEEDFERYRKAFRLAVARCWALFGETAFEKSVSDQIRRRKNSTLFEAWSTALTNISGEEMAVLCSKQNLLIDKHYKLMSDDNEYIKSITYSTQKKDHFRIRRDKVRKIIEEVINA